MTRYHARVLHSIEKKNVVPLVVLVVESKGPFFNFLVNLHFFFSARPETSARHRQKGIATAERRLHLEPTANKIQARSGLFSII